MRSGQEVLIGARLVRVLVRSLGEVPVAVVDEDLCVGVDRSERLDADTFLTRVLIDVMEELRVGRLARAVEVVEEAPAEEAPAEEAPAEEAPAEEAPSETETSNDEQSDESTSDDADSDDEKK